jgi:hypothetical protein
MWNYASQNIGAYGTEIKTLCFLRGNNRKSDIENTKDECHFDTEKAF